MESTKIVITSDIIKKASTYIPIMEKQRMVEAIAPLCVAKVKLSYIPTGAADNETQSAPDRHQEVKCLTNLFLMGILAHEYLRMPYDGDEARDGYRHLQMPANVYDKWAGSHVMNQLERLKKDKDLTETIFDLMYDYKEMRWLLANEIETILGHNNDPVWRLMDAFNHAVTAEVNGAIEPMIAQARERAEKEKASEPQTQEEKIAAAKKTLAQMDAVSEKLKNLDKAREKLREQLEIAEKGEGQKDA